MFADDVADPGGNFIQTSGVSFGIAGSGTAIVLVGWGASIVLILLGRFRKRPPLLGAGIVAVGLMTLLTPLAFYLYFAIRDGEFELSPGGILVLAGLAFLGGFVSCLGIPFLRSAMSSTAAPTPGKR